MLIRFRNYLIARRLRKMRPSAILTLALDTFERVEHSPNYVIDMGVWRQHINDHLTAVCFAGAFWSELFVLPRARRSYVWRPRHPRSGLPRIAHTLVSALDFVRCGYVGNFFKKVGLTYESGQLFDCYVPSYSRDPVEWHTRMRQIVQELKKEGY